jgi:hypothetical protein
VDYHANVEFRSLRGQRKTSLEKLVLRCSFHFAVVELREETLIGDLNIRAQDPTTPIEDINVVIASWKKRINLGRLGRHEEWEKVSDELQHCTDTERELVAAMRLQSRTCKLKQALKLKLIENKRPSDVNPRGVDDLRSR